MNKLYLLLVLPSLWAQTKDGTAPRISYTGTIAQIAALTCNSGNKGALAFATDATAGQNIYGCTGTTWAQEGGSGGSTIPSVTNIIKGNGSGNGADTKVAISSPATAATLSFPTDNATISFQGTDTYVGRATTDTLTNKTLTTPTIGSFTNATHNHTNAAGGGQLNITTASNATGTPSSSTFLRGDNTWNTPAGSGTVTVSGGGSVTSTALVTGAGTTVIQTPSATSTLDSSGNLNVAGSLSSGTAPAVTGPGIIGGTETTGQVCAASVDCIIFDATSHSLLASYNNDTAKQVTRTIANGTATLGTSLISSGACATVVTVSATNVATSDNIMADFNGDPTGVTGWAPSANGGLFLYKYPTANNVNFKVCNNTSASITPGAITLNWRVTR